jgi:transcriptional regulator with XRE-family HTH domain
LATGCDPYAKNGSYLRATSKREPACCVVENGHTIPMVETLEKWARALDVPLYQIFYEGENPPATPQPIEANGGLDRADARFLAQMHRALSRTKETDRQLLLAMARKLAKGKAA